LVGCVVARPGEFRRGRHGTEWLRRAGTGKLCQGTARQAWRGLLGLVVERRVAGGRAWQGGHGLARPAWLGKFSRGEPRLGMVGQGMAGKAW
jgi:hypothetical protein